MADTVKVTFNLDTESADICSEFRKYFYKRHSNVRGKEFLIRKVGLWIVTSLSADNTLHGSCRAKIGKAAESTDADLTFRVYTFEDALAHVAISNISEILAIKSYS